MTERERFIKALRREPIEGHCPTFELEFFLTLEALGRIHPSQKNLAQWDQMSKQEQKLHIAYDAQTYVEFAEKYHHSAIFMDLPTTQLEDPEAFDKTVRLFETIREKTGNQYFLMLEGDPTFPMPDGENMMAFSERMFEDEDGLIAEAEHRLSLRLKVAEKLSKIDGLIDGFMMASDYCFNTNPFFSPAMFETFIAPYLSKAIDAYRDMGFYSIKHTDGNIMPILDQIVDCKPDALHSLDPQARVSLAEVKRLYGDRVALCGNVNCGLLQTGTEEDVIADVRRSLKEGMEGNGYIFCTSNCVYTGMPLERYELMNRIWREEGIYRT